MFAKILIANRGEIALRVIRACRKMGIRGVAVYSDADARALHVQEADEAVRLGGARPAESYLNVDRVLAAAKAAGCEAIHPGYGFLSENPAFARAVVQAGLVFIGPPADAIALLGDKMASKQLARRIGVPVVPGPEEPAASVDAAIAVAREIGFPVILKPAAGGGGRGMRVVTGEGEFASAFVAARDEARKGFGDDRLFVERYVQRPRHIEVQIVADNRRNVIHLGERECSIQRRHQKIIEESPSVAVGPALRASLGDWACALARAVGYTSAGTAEFMLDENGAVYFLEMNTRLQVEHPVTELVTGLDLVEMQIRIAAGEPLPLTQDEVTRNGWAIEARICAEDPARGFVPTTGTITRYAAPKGAGVRVDSGVAVGSVVTIHYDSLLAKVIAWGPDREAARETLVAALNGYHVEGVTTNVDFAGAVLAHPAFAQGRLSTDFLDEHFENGESKAPPPRETIEALSVAAVLVHHNRRARERDSLRPMRPLVGGEPETPRAFDYVVRAGDTVFPVTLQPGDGADRWVVGLDGRAHDVATPPFEFYRRRLRMTLDGRTEMFRLQYDGGHIRACFRGVVRLVEIYTPREWALAHHVHREKKTVRENVLRCPMPGVVTEVAVTPGTYVRRGQVLVRLESMKMESAVASPLDGDIDRVLVEPGRNIDSGEVLVTFK
jgi:propionyl-CoA carboxylase alpha chain